MKKENEIKYHITVQGAIQIDLGHGQTFAESG